MSATEELNIWCYFLLIRLNFNSAMWLVTIVLAGAVTSGSSPFTAVLFTFIGLCMDSILSLNSHLAICCLWFFCLTQYDKNQICKPHCSWSWRITEISSKSLQNRKNQGFLGGSEEPGYDSLIVPSKPHVHCPEVRAPSWEVLQKKMWVLLLKRLTCKRF